MEVVLWILIGTIVYSYVGYIAVLFVISLFKKANVTTATPTLKDLPAVTLFVAAYNEESVVSEKIQNTLALDYPKEKLQYLWITDGSSDNTLQELKKFSDIEIEHAPIRNGKIGAINRGMPFAKGDIVIFSDANSMLSSNTVYEIIKQFEDQKVGCVAGSKNIYNDKTISQVGVGEQWYWKYENSIKSLESAVKSTVGAAGELFAVRRMLFTEVAPDTILDDFVISIKLVLANYKIAFAPKAYAYESASVSFSDEDKRKSRIAAGCMQTLLRYPMLLNPFKTGFFAFQYFSHKVLRWLVVPFAIFLIPVLSLTIAYQNNFSSIVYTILSSLSALIFLLFLLSLIPAIARTKSKFFLFPQFLILMNLSVLKGYLKYFRGKQSVNWEKVNRTYS